MGSWGVNLWDCDTAMDIKNEYSRFLKYSFDDEDALRRFFRNNEKLLSDSDDNPIVLMILAKQMWEYGRLSEDIKRLAYTAIDNDLRNWEDGDAVLYNKRKMELAKYREKLDSPQPERKKVKRSLPFENHWKKGDVVALKYNGFCRIRETAESPYYDFTGGYILLMFERMEGEFPVFYTMFADVEKVYSEMDISVFPYIQYFERTDSNGKMVYRTEIQIYGNDQQKKLTFLGNYPHHPLPCDDDKEMNCIIPFERFASYSITSYFYMNKHFAEVKDVRNC